MSRYFTINTIRPTFKNKTTSCLRFKGIILDKYGFFDIHVEYAPTFLVSLLSLITLILSFDGGCWRLNIIFIFRNFLFKTFAKLF